MALLDPGRPVVEGQTSFHFPTRARRRNTASGESFIGSLPNCGKQESLRIDRVSRGVSVSNRRRGGEPDGFANLSYVPE